MKNPLLSKTIDWNLIMLVVSGAMMLPEVQAIVPLDFMPYFLAINAVVGLVLRFMTNTGVSFDKEG